MRRGIVVGRRDERVWNAKLVSPFHPERAQRARCHPERAQRVEGSALTDHPSHSAQRV